MLRAPWPFRKRAWFSAKSTSSTQCSWFSILQWLRTAVAASLADKTAEAMYSASPINNDLAIRPCIGAGGLDVDTPTAPITLTVIVVPGKSNLRRGDDGARVTAYIEIYTDYPLSAGYKTNDASFRDADVILWHGRRISLGSIFERNSL